MEKEKSRDAERESFCASEGWMKSDGLDTVGWSVAAIWAGIVLLANITGFGGFGSSWESWAVFLTGAGVVTLAGVTVRIVTSIGREKIAPGIIFGAILLSIGLGEVTAWIWVTVLVAIGFVFLQKSLSPRKES